MLPGKISTPSYAPAMEIDLARLPGEYKRPVWKWMLSNRPAVCAFLGGENCKLIASMMDASPVLNLNESEAQELMKLVPGLSRYAI